MNVNANPRVDGHGNGSADADADADGKTRAPERTSMNATIKLNANANPPAGARSAAWLLVAAIGAVGLGAAGCGPDLVPGSRIAKTRVLGARVEVGGDP